MDLLFFLNLANVVTIKLKWVEFKSIRKKFKLSIRTDGVPHFYIKLYACMFVDDIKSIITLKF